ncbi:unnamed protein product [Moneuplotes crassus]|uniref:PPM-type phosphatase domain-containing protein n=1 Tax=Euplotes crassus TaxID=5936 RepID=A0AAD1U1U8_EUPCR|nr:unnamed protein product [Moneuplotes crassus]
MIKNTDVNKFVNLKHKVLPKPNQRDLLDHSKILQNQVSKYSFATKKGISLKRNVPPKSSENQDSYIASPKMMGYNFLHLFAICDGHGTNGHKASNFLRNTLPKELKNRLQEETRSNGSQSLDISKLAEQGKCPLSQDMYNLFVNSFLDTNDSLIRQEFDTKFSGSTCCALLIYEKKIFCANVGDSRCILIRIPNLKQRLAENSHSSRVQKSSEDAKELKITVLELSRDHKPDDHDERERIESNGGEIQSYINSKGICVGPKRVWVKNHNFPGLAMSRSFGDEIASRVGVSACPEIKETTLTHEDAYIVIASDGVWEFLENKEVAEIVYEYYVQGNAEKAAEAIVKEAFDRWKNREIIVDDITCIVLFLDIKD